LKVSAHVKIVMPCFENFGGGTESPIAAGCFPVSKRELQFPCAWKSVISVTCSVFPFSLLWSTLLTCSGRAIMTAT